MTENCCVMCGEIIPEGRMVCPSCECSDIQHSQTGYIYAITVFEKVSIPAFGWPDYGAMRTVAWYSRYDDALAAVMSNNCDMWEYLYDYAVLETLPEGMYPTTEPEYQRQYFKYDRSQNKYYPIDTSEVEVSGIMQIWSMG